VDLRLTLLAIPPVIPLIHRDLHLDESGIAALSNLPVLVLAGSSVFGALLVARLGVRRALVAGLALIALAGALRGAGPSLAMLFAMTFAMGVGIALIQPAFPTLSRAWFPDRVSFGTAVWANGLLCGEAIAASLTIPLILPLTGGSWEASLALWSVPVAVTAALFALAPDPGGRAPAGAAWFPDFRSRDVWRLGTFQSAASLAYFGANTFMPDFLHATHQPQLVAPCLAALNIGQIPASIAVGLLPTRALARPTTMYAVAALILIALLCFIFAGGAAAVAAAVVLGLTTAYVLTVSFALPAFLAAPDQIPRISAGTFTLGYAIAFVTAVVSGAAWDASRSPVAAFLPLLAAAAIVATVGPRFAPLVARACPATARAFR
jgi:CP family cyanate transporter-like MFS transporter